MFDLNMLMLVSFFFILFLCACTVTQLFAQDSKGQEKSLLKKLILNATKIICFIHVVQMCITILITWKQIFFSTDLNCYGTKVCTQVEKNYFANFCLLQSVGSFNETYLLIEIGKISKGAWKSIMLTSGVVFICEIFGLVFRCATRR